MNKSIGFIGSGNMGNAIIGGIIESGLIMPSNIIASDIAQTTLDHLHKKYGISTTTDNLEVAKKVDVLFLAVKPNIYPLIIKEIKEVVKENIIIVVIAAGQSIEAVERLFGREIKVVRTMPNTPALVGEGMTGVCPNELLSQDEKDEILSIFNCIGKAEIVGEYLMDTVTAISGSSPAYVYMFIEAMADAAVAQGMPRGQAYKFAAQAVLGAAKMVVETGEHPGVLKDQVCSPGGTTIAAVCELEKKGMRDAVISAVNVCADKSKSMSQQ